MNIGNFTYTKDIDISLKNNKEKNKIEDTIIYYEKSLKINESPERKYLNAVMSLFIDNDEMEQFLKERD